MDKHKGSDVVPHYTTTYIRRQNALDGNLRDPYRVARMFNMGRHHPLSSWQRKLRPRVTVY
jgi:hypothetical protein